jgi:2-oxoglutarate ferredoxin oxidoreductase subunit delta
MEPRNIKLTFVEEYCKGCGICVHFCPANVMELLPIGRLKIVNPDDCTGCGACQLRCPDFAFTVEVGK